MAAACVYLDRANNTTCTINLLGKYLLLRCTLFTNLFLVANTFLFLKLLVTPDYLTTKNLTYKFLCFQLIYTFFSAGATVVSWRVNNQEQLFVR